MPPEIQNALVILLVAAIGLLTIIFTGIGLILKAVFERRAKKIQAASRQEVADLEAKLQSEAHVRQLEYQENMANLAEKAEMRGALDRQSENLANLVDAIVDLVKTDHRKTDVLAAHTRELTGNTEAVSHLEIHIDQLAEIVTQTHDKSDATLKRADDVVKAVDRLYDLMMTKFPTDDKSAAEEAREVLIEVVNKVCDKRKGDSQELPAITDAPPAGESEAA